MVDISAVYLEGTGFKPLKWRLISGKVWTKSDPMFSRAKDRHVDCAVNTDKQHTEWRKRYLALDV
jgi:hypothetical protein